MLVAARLTAWKGQKILVEAARRLHGQGLEDVRYILAGDAQGRDGYVKELDALIEKAGLVGVVSRVGHCDDMPAAFMIASVLAAPSIAPEAFGRVAVEAQAMGAMVVVSDRGAVPETVLAPRKLRPRLEPAGASPRRSGGARRRIEGRAVPGRDRARSHRAPRARACREPFLARTNDPRNLVRVYIEVVGLSRGSSLDDGRRSKNANALGGSDGACIGCDRLAARVAGRLSCVEAGELLGLSERHFRRLRDAHEDRGEEGLVDRRRGRVSSSRVPEAEAEWLAEMFRTRYFDFTAKHFHGQVVGRPMADGKLFHRSYNCVKSVLQLRGLTTKAPRRGVHRRKRERRPLPGMMLFQDGSKHAWLGQGPDLDLIVTMDDATSAITSIFLCEEEGTASQADRTLSSEGRNGAAAAASWPLDCVGAAWPGYSSV